MKLTSRQKDSLRQLQAKVQRKLSLALTSMAYIRGTNAHTIRELTAQIEALNIVINQGE